MQAAALQENASRKVPPFGCRAALATTCVCWSPNTPARHRSESVRFAGCAEQSGGGKPLHRRTASHRKDRGEHALTYARGLTCEGANTPPRFPERAPAPPFAVPPVVRLTSKVEVREARVGMHGPGQLRPSLRPDAVPCRRAEREEAEEKEVG
jgi:hypothetical protein